MEVVMKGRSAGPHERFVQAVGKHFAADSASGARMSKVQLGTPLLEDVYLCTLQESYSGPDGFMALQTD